ncbi:hypothetical protein OZX69_00625 [Lactobacillus sp. ESL0731]|uniref:hypothetical protein n=1 Tax=unclassified Lactobacillus TaxID=2620435 RepID=UPI0023F94921|nr:MULTISPECIES: hypothetical protein [unclassified Lactobacillus]WEV51263.1 hypothetical protein OZX63_00625 [Lactobacillus sp. ESL0700]WEV62393.1 hypothetical protein OZX69_00625 [Lactobacillus sp. ESL0731]
MKQVLFDKYLNKNVLLQVYSKSRNAEDFLLGYLISETANYCVFEAIDEYGALDAYVLYQKSDIEDVVTKSKYIDIFNSYIALQKQQGLFDPFSLQAKYLKVPQDNINDLLNYHCNNGNVVSLNIGGYDLSNTGKVIAVSEDYVILDQASYYRDWDSDSNISNQALEISRITTIDIVSKDNFLYENYCKLRK